MELISFKDSSSPKKMNNLAPTENIQNIDDNTGSMESEKEYR